MASLVYRVSSRTARAIQRKPCLKKKMRPGEGVGVKVEVERDVSCIVPEAMTVSSLHPAAVAQRIVAQATLAKMFFFIKIMLR